MSRGGGNPAAGSANPEAIRSRASRVVHVVARYPPAVGGTEHLVQALARHQRELGLEVEVLTSDLRPTGTRPEDEAFPVTRFRSAEVAHTPVFPGLLPGLRRIGRDAVVHLHISSAFAPEMVWLSARLARTRYVAHVHLDVLPSGPAGVLLEPYKRLVLRRVLHDADAILVPTADYLPLISEKYGLPAGRIQIVPCGTDHALESQARDGWSGSGIRRLLFVGRLSPQKNIPLLLEAVSAYRHNHEGKFELEIIGEGALRGKIEALIASLGLADVVRMRGAGPQLQSAYQQADLLLLTSVNESFGLVLVEAMTKALPIVSVNIPAVRNVMTNGVNGLMTDASPAALADAIHTLLTDRDRYAAMSRNNLERARSYSWRAVAEQLVPIYQSIGLAGPARSSL